MANPTDNWLFSANAGQLPPLPQLGQRQPMPPVDPWASLGQMGPQGGAGQMPPMPNAGGLNLQQFTQQRSPRDMFMPYLMSMAAQQMMGGYGQGAMNPGQAQFTPSDPSLYAPSNLSAMHPAPQYVDQHPDQFSGATAAAPPTKAATTAAAPAGNFAVDSSSPSAFFQSLAPAARQIATKYNIPYKAILAIAANETGYGKYSTGNNYFGIKGQGPEGSNNSATWEVVNGQRQDITDDFRAYNGAMQSMEDFAKLVTESPRYQSAIGVQDPYAFAEALRQGGYATDPDWGTKIGSIASGIED